MPASRQMSTRREASATSELPQALKTSFPPSKVAVPKLRIGTVKPDRPRRRYSKLTSWERRRLVPASIHDELTGRHETAVVGREPQHHTRHVSLVKAVGDALPGRAFGLGFRSHPEVELTLGDDPTREHDVGTDVVGAEIAREAARKAYDARLGGGVGGEAALRHEEADRTHVDDRAAAGRDHVVLHRLRTEKLMAEIGRHAVVPIF